MCPKCNSETSILHGDKVRCPCGTWSDMEGIVLDPPKTSTKTVGYTYHKPIDFNDPPEGGLVTMKPMQHPLLVIDLETVDGSHPLHTERVRTMFNYTSPDEKKVEFTIEERDEKFIIFSRAYPITKDGHGSAINFVAEKDSMEAAEELVARLKKL